MTTTIAASKGACDPMCYLISWTISIRDNSISPTPGASQTWSGLFPYFPNAGASQNEIFFVSPDAAVFEALNFPGWPTSILHKLDFPEPGAPKGMIENARDDSIWL